MMFLSYQPCDWEGNPVSISIVFTCDKHCIIIANRQRGCHESPLLRCQSYALRTAIYTSVDAVTIVNRLANDLDAQRKLDGRNPSAHKIHSTEYLKKDIVPSLKRVASQPEGVSDLFGYSEYSNNLYDLLMNALPEKPIAICLDWIGGQGKTSIMREIFAKMQNNSATSNNLVLWYDAWKLERLEPSIVLLTAIADLCESHKMNSKVLKKILDSASTVSSAANLDQHINLPQAALSNIIKEVIAHVDDAQLLTEALGEKRLFIFVDNLDRCKPEAINEMFRAMSTQFNSRRIRFMVAADLARIEMKLTPFQGNDSGLYELPRNLTDIDKVFQLKFVLPRKDDKMMQEYVESLVGSFPQEIKDLLAAALPRNPRQAKEALNLAYYLSNISIGKDFGEMFPYILLRSIIDSTHARLSKIVREFPEIFYDLTLMVSQTKDHSDFIRIFSASTGDESFLLINLRLPRESIGSESIELAHKLVQRDLSLYTFLKAVATAFEVNTSTDTSTRSKIVNGVRKISQMC